MSLQSKCAHRVSMSLSKGSSAQNKTLILTQNTSEPQVKERNDDKNCCLVKKQVKPLLLPPGALPR